MTALAPDTIARMSPRNTDALFRIALISTGGTIEKTYDELGGVLSNKLSVLDMLLATLDLRGVTIDRVPLMNKDSLDMTEADHDLIADTAEIMSRNHDGVVIVHGTDRLAKTGDRIHDRLEQKGGAKKARKKAEAALAPNPADGPAQPDDLGSPTGTPPVDGDDPLFN